MSEYLSKPAPPPAPEVEWIKPMVPAEQSKSLEFFNQLAFLLQITSVNPAEAALRKRFESIGIVPGNPINRYSIGDRTKGLQYGEDGSLTIYVSNTSPGKDKESNWLPAPAAKCSLVARVYGPNKAAMKGQWKLPPLEPEK